MNKENDQELSAAQINLINQLNDTDLKTIDDALLANISTQWRKLARVVATTMMNIENRVEGIPDVLYAQRVIDLANKGIIESQGNLNKMRYSEVRIAKK